MVQSSKVSVNKRVRALLVETFKIDKSQLTKALLFKIDSLRAREIRVYAVNILHAKVSINKLKVIYK